MLSLLLSRPTPERKSEVHEIAQGPIGARLTEIARAWCDNATEGAYLQLLGPGGLVPARSVAYRPFADPGWVLADLARYRQAFGFHPATEEPADHVAVLADFVSYLLLKQAYARESGDPGAVAVTQKSMERFIDEHLSPVAGRIAERLDACGATDWSAAAHLLAERVPAPPPIARASGQEEQTLECAGCGPVGVRPVE
jgi:TorA maturation chaperone TorD